MKKLLTIVGVVIAFAGTTLATCDTNFEGCASQEVPGGVFVPATDLPHIAAHCTSGTTTWKDGKCTSGKPSQYQACWAKTVTKQSVTQKFDVTGDGECRAGEKITSETAVTCPNADASCVTE